MIYSKQLGITKRNETKNNSNPIFKQREKRNLKNKVVINSHFYVYVDVDRSSKTNGILLHRFFSYNSLDVVIVIILLRLLMRAIAREKERENEMKKKRKKISFLTTTTTTTIKCW